jgi:hypothetical protein
MDDDSPLGGMMKWALGVAGICAVASLFLLPSPYGIYVAVAILILFLLLFGGYFLWRRSRVRRQREQFSSAIEAQTAAAPKSISDPNKRADLDRIRQKFQTGLQEFKSRGKDIYKLPWHVIIGESGSGKTEAIRHSGIDFPPGLQDELQGSGGTVNMDWWFTNRGIILDTAGSMLFNEARAGESPEWREFLRLLKRARPQCPVNGLFLVLSVESLIKDSADAIAQKASRLAQQLDFIQRTLDVRFPVFLLVTKCDLLTGFREFFDSIQDPLLQHQMFGWSNPDPLDAHFQPDCIEQHLNSVAARLRRRRMALIRDTSGTGRLGDTQQFFASTYQLGRGPAPARRLDEVDSLFALPESVMRLAPRLRRYLETIFVAGEWSAKPVFLRGIYFTSSMREGKALDEAISLATGIPLDQLPEDYAWGEKNRAYFLRDLFLEKVFRESGLVTRATNTLKLLRQRQLAIFGSAGLALVLLLVFASFAYNNLKQTVGKESQLWQAGATNWNQGEWSPPIVRAGTTPTAPYVYAGDEPLPTLGKMTLLDYHKQLRKTAEKPLQVGWVFKPMSWLRPGKDEGRPQAQRLLFEGSVLRPLIARTRDKLQSQDAPSGDAALARHLEALLALIQLEADGSMVPKEPLSPPVAEKYLRTFLTYLTETNTIPNTNLVEVFAWTYDTKRGGKAGQWPSVSLLGGATLAENAAISGGLDKFQKASAQARTNIDNQAAMLNDFSDRLKEYNDKELAWLANPTALCSELAPLKSSLDAARLKFESSTRTAEPITSLFQRYLSLQAAASNSSASALSAPINLIRSRLPSTKQNSGLLPEIITRLGEFASQAAAGARSGYEARRAIINSLDATCMARVPGSSKAAHELRADLYAGACALASFKMTPEETDLGDGWKRYALLTRNADQFRTNLAAYNGPLAAETSAACSRLATDTVQRLRTSFVDAYPKLVADKLAQINVSQWSAESVTNAGVWLSKVQADIDKGKAIGIGDTSLAAIASVLADGREQMLASMDRYIIASAAFPACLGAKQDRSLQDLDSLRRMLEGLSRELQAPVWQCTSSALASLRTDCGRHAAVANALVKEDGTSAEWDLYFIPPDLENDKNLIRVFRYVQVGLGSQKSNWEELTRVSTPLLLGKGSADSPVRISFKKLESDPIDTLAIDPTPWGLVRLISGSYSAERLDDGMRWRFHIRPKGDDFPDGHVIFEARLKRALPRKEDWPSVKP